MTTILSKIHKLLDLAEDVGEKQLRDEVAALLVKRCVSPPICLDLVYGNNVPNTLTWEWLVGALNSFEQFHGRRPDSIKVTTRQRRAIRDLIYVPPTCPPTEVTHFDGIPLRVIAHCREGGGITG